MHGLGTLINMAAIAGGGIIGLLFGKRFEKRFQEILMTAVGACVVFVVVDGVLEKNAFCKRRPSSKRRNRNDDRLYGNRRNNRRIYEN